jgi:hypothetical protein
MNEKQRTSTVVIIAAWAIVTIPAAWGIYNTALNAAKLFGTVARSGSNVPTGLQPANVKQ